jgi:diguanylate cyclase (GGDEF)-like protein
MADARESAAAEGASAARGPGPLVDQLFATVVRTVGESLDVTTVDLWTFSPDADSFECRAFWSGESPDSPDLACVGTVVPLAQSGDLRRLFLTGETVEHHVDDPGISPAELAYLEQHGYRSKIDTPLLVGDEVVGVLSIAESRSVRRLTGEDERHFLSLRDLSAAALQAAGLVMRSAERNRGLRGLLASAHDMGSSLEVRAAADRARAEVSGLLPGIACELDVRLRQDDGSFAAVGAGTLAAAPAPSPADNLARQALEKMAPVQGKTADGRRRIVLPLVAGGEATGYFDVRAALVRRFRDDEVELLRLLADQSAVALAGARALRALERRAAIDTDTGFFSTWYFYERLYSEVARARRYTQPLALVLAAVDDFPDWSGVHGREAAGAVLRSAARMVKGCLRDKVDVACRDGESGFAVLLPSTTGPGAGAGIVAERMRTMVGRTAVTDDDLGALGTFTLSVGVAAFPTQAEDADELVSAAREALREAAEAGGNVVRTSAE